MFMSLRKHAQIFALVSSSGGGFATGTEVILSQPSIEGEIILKDGVTNDTTVADLMKMLIEGRYVPIQQMVKLVDARGVAVRSTDKVETLLGGDATLHLQLVLRPRTRASQESQLLEEGKYWKIIDKESKAVLLTSRNITRNFSAELKRLGLPPLGSSLTWHQMIDGKEYLLGTSAETFEPGFLGDRMAGFLGDRLPYKLYFLPLDHGKIEVCELPDDIDLTPQTKIFVSPFGNQIVVCHDNARPGENIILQNAGMATISVAGEEGHQCDVLHTKASGVELFSPSGRYLTLMQSEMGQIYETKEMTEIVRPGAYKKSPVRFVTEKCAVENLRNIEVKDGGHTYTFGRFEGFSGDVVTVKLQRRDLQNRQFVCTRDFNVKTGKEVKTREQEWCAFM